jgi:hypothetical protein
MTFNEEIADLKQRLAKAESDRDTWRTSGMQEKYLESCSLVDALELQLDGMQREGLRISARAPRTGHEYRRYRHDLLADAVDYARLQRSSLSPGADDGPVISIQQVERPNASEREVMAGLGISCRDGIYHLGDYRYERLADAINYARLQLANGTRT